MMIKDGIKLGVGFTIGAIAIKSLDSFICRTVRVTKKRMTKRICDNLNNGTEYPEWFIKAYGIRKVEVEEDKVIGFQL